MGVASIESYSFGHICIDGKNYDSDVLVYTDHVDAGWWRKDGHNLQLQDLNAALERSPEVLIIGTGTFGRMRVAGELIKDLENKGIRVVVAKTSTAVKHFNEIAGKEQVIAALHLSC